MGKLCIFDASYILSISVFVNGIVFMKIFFFDKVIMEFMPYPCETFLILMILIYRLINIPIGNLIHDMYPLYKYRYSILLKVSLVELIFFKNNFILQTILILQNNSVLQTILNFNFGNIY